MANNNLVQSLLRGLDVLNIVADSEEGIRLNELTERIGLKKTTVHNLARTLVARNFLSRDNESKYILGKAVSEMAAKYKDKSIEHQALLTMQRIVKEFPESTVVFGEDTGAEIYLKMRYSPEKPNVLQRPRNFTFQPYANGAGLVYLAFAEKEKVKAIKDAYPFFEFGAHLWKTEGELNQYLKKVRKSGTAVVPFETGKSLRVSAPVMDGSHKIAGVLGTSTPRILIKSKEQENKIINMTKQKASEIVK